MDIIHAFDQIQSMLRDLAPLLYKYKKYLKEEGFTDQEAFILTKEFQMILLKNNNEE